MTPSLEEGQIRFVLSWPNNPKDIDIHSLFKISRMSKCEVFFGKRECGGTTLDIDNFNYGINGVETITINTMSSFVYAIAVHKFIDVTTNNLADGDTPIDSYYEEDDEKKDTDNSSAPSQNTDLPLMDSGAKISVYIAGFKQAIVQLPVPSKFSNENGNNNAGNDNKFTWWHALCLDGKQGIDSLSVVNTISEDKPDSSDCEKIYLN